MKMKIGVIAALLLTALAGPAAAQETPVGLWKTIDYDGKTEKSLVRITEVNGVLVGKIEKILEAEHQNAVCQKCSDERKDKPVLGLVILRNHKQDADDKATWAGGEALDPVDGKTYRSRIRWLDGGKRLQLRGYLGPFFRTQVWQRVE